MNTVTHNFGYVSLSSSRQGVAAVLRSLPHPPLRPYSALQWLAGLDRRI